MSTSTTTNLNLIKDNSDEPIVNLRTHLNTDLDTLDESLGSILQKFDNSGAIKSLDDNQYLPIQYGGTGLTASPSMLIYLDSTSADNVLKVSPRPGVVGTLGVGNGGTGLTSSPSMLTNLSSTSADTVLKASPRPGVTGTLAVGNGGTGLTSSPSMLVNLESTLTDNVLKASPRPGVTGKLPTTHGGTGQGDIKTYDKPSMFITAGSGCSISTAFAYRWGYVLEIFLGITCNSTKSSGNVIATLNQGFRPVTTTPLMNAGAPTQGAAAYTNGEVQAKGTVSAGGSFYVAGTYLLLALPPL